MTEENEKLIDEYIAFVQSTSKKYEQIGDSLLNKKLIINCGAAI